MTAFLFIPATLDTGDARRVDFAHITSLFAECEEPVRAPDAGRNLLRAAAAVLLVLLAISDTLLVMRPGATAGFPAPPPAARRAIL